MPLPDVTRRLYLASGNRCAFPQCDQPLMGVDAVLVGEIAHIEGALADSARFNPKMSNEQRRNYDNLILVCRTHHATIDRNPEHWTVAKLKDLKRKHEAIYTAAVDQLRRQVSDITDGVSYTPAVNGLAILDPDGLNERERAESCKVINRFAELLASIPYDARSVLALIVERGDMVGGYRQIHSNSELEIPVRVLKSLADCSSARLNQHTEVLEHFELLSLEVPDDSPPVYVVGDSTSGNGWPLLQEIRHLAGEDRSVVRRILCDLDFSAFDLT